jgi:hypothetical protein
LLENRLPCWEAKQAAGGEGAFSLLLLLAAVLSTNQAPETRPTSPRMPRSSILALIGDISMFACCARDVADELVSVAAASKLLSRRLQGCLDKPD